MVQLIGMYEWRFTVPGHVVGDVTEDGKVIDKITTDKEEVDRSRLEHIEAYRDQARQKWFVDHGPTDERTELVRVVIESYNPPIDI